MGYLRSNSSFLRLFVGRLVTNAGDSMYLIASMWLVYELTHSTLYTGIAGFLLQAPRSIQFLFGPLVDRWRLRYVLIGTQLIQSIGVLIIPVAAFTDQLSVWLLLSVMATLATLNQFVYPAQNALLPQIVNDENLVRANSLFSSAYQAANTILNAVSGVLITLIGVMTLFVVDSITFLVAAILFWGIVIPTEFKDEVEVSLKKDEKLSSTDEQPLRRSDDEGGRDTDEQSSYVIDLHDGINYIRGSLILKIVIGTMVSNIGFGAAYAVLPAYADSLGGPEIFGVLMALFAGGTFVGTIAATLVEGKPYGVLSIIGFCSAGLALLISLFVPGILATFVLFFVTFIPIGVFNVLFFSLLQSVIDNDYLGRVTSVVGSLNSVMMPLGSLVGGFLAGIIGVTAVLGGLALLFILLGIYFLARHDLRALPPIGESDEKSLHLTIE